jgi:hypothetical protein
MTFPKYTYPPVNNRICTFPTGYVQKAIEEKDYLQLSKEFNVEVPAIKAFIAVESKGSGFELSVPAPTIPKILLEAHIVYKTTKSPVSKIRPDLSQPDWNRGKKFYIGGSSEYFKRLLPLMAILQQHGEAPIRATLCCSWGLGQVMGFNYAIAGCSTLERFVEECHAGEYWQARHMMYYLKNTNIIPFLKTKNWAKVAEKYNGKGYKANKYDTKLAAAYRRFSR